MMWTLPNVLTVLRLLAAPMLAVMFVVFPRPFADWAGIFVFVTASATDWLDGQLARAWAQQTRLGTMLDPIADKAMVVIALMVVAAVSELASQMMLPAALILLREVFVSGLREFLGETAGKLSVTKLAKWKTAVQMSALTVLLLYGALPGLAILAPVGVALLWAAAGLTLITGVDYLRKAMPYLRD